MTDPLLSTDALVWPTLQAMKALGGAAHVLDIERAVVEREKINAETQAVPHDDHGTKLNYRLRWARTELQYMGAVENLKRGSGMWRVTTLGETLSYDEFEHLLRDRRARKGDTDVRPPDDEVDLGLNSSFVSVARGDGFNTFGRIGAPVIEDLAKSILWDCLVNDGSILGGDIWTLDNLGLLHEHYVDQPLTSGGTFHEKLAIQLSGIQFGARQLFAELYILNILPIISFKQTTKLSYIEDVLSPIEPALEITPAVSNAFKFGVFHGGRAFSNRRWAQLSLLIEFAEYFKRQNAVAREVAATDPMTMRDLVLDSPGHREPAQRYALLYLFHPKFFLPIINPSHRVKLRDSLSSDYLPGGPTSDVDVDLRSIDDAVIAENGGPADFYSPAWRTRWLESKDRQTDHETDDDASDGEHDSNAVSPYSVGDIVHDGCFHDAGRLKQILSRWEGKKNLILQGAPGTGKTWLARRLAYALIGFRTQAEIRSVQFHPSTSYEDFVRGWRPATAADGTGKLTLVDGPLLRHAELARAQPDIPHVLIIEEINRGNPSQIFGEMLTLIEATKREQSEALALSYTRDPKETIYLPPNLYLLGTMNVADRSLALVDFALRRRFAFETLEPAYTDTWKSALRAKLPNDKDLVDVIRDKVRSLNDRIAGDPALGPDFVIGHSFFTPPDTQSSGVEWFAGVISSEIAPLLREYWFDNRSFAEEAIADLRG